MFEREDDIIWLRWQAFTALLDGVAFSFDPTKTFRLVQFAAFYMGPAVRRARDLRALTP